MHPAPLPSRQGHTPGPTSFYGLMGFYTNAHVPRLCASPLGGSDLSVTTRPSESQIKKGRGCPSTENDNKAVHRVDNSVQECLHFCIVFLKEGIVLNIAYETGKFIIHPL